MKKIKFLLLFISLLNLVKVDVQAQNSNIQVVGKALQTICNNSKSTFLFYYPQIDNLTDKNIKKKVNQYLKKEFTGFKNGTCSDDNQGDSYQEEINYQVKVNKNGVLSIYYENSGYLSGAAHPNNVLDSYNLSLKTGKPFEFKNIFRNDKNYLKKINYMVKKSLAARDIEISLEDSGTDFDFYLTEKQLVIINLFDSHAVQAIEVPINYSYITDIIDLNGPLKPLL
jgi:hypothetical protein